MADNDPTERALLLLSLLQTHRFWPGAELTERLGISARTLRRDVDRLRSLGYPVDATPGAAGGYRLATGAHLPPLLLDDEEAVAIAVGLRTAAGASIDGIEDTALRALAKLEQVLPDRLRRRVHAVHTNIVSLQWGGGPTVDADALAVLALACRDTRAGPLRLPPPRRRRLEPPGRAPPARVNRTTVVSRRVGRPPRRLAHVPPRPARAAAARPACGARARELPGGDAAAFVAESIRTMPLPHSAVLEVDGARRRRCATCSAGATPRSRSSATVAPTCASAAAATRRCCASSPGSRDGTRSSSVEPDELAARVEQLVVRLRR